MSAGGVALRLLAKLDHIERAIQSTDAWLARNGLQKSGIPDEMRPHAH